MPTTITETELAPRHVGRPSGAYRVGLCERGEWACMWCGCQVEYAPLMEDDEEVGLATLDHIHCYIDGGSWDPTNLVVACRSCNSRRQDTHIDEWIARIARERLPYEFVPGTWKETKERKAARRALRAELARAVARQTRLSVSAALYRVARDERFPTELRDKALKLARQERANGR